LRFTLGSKLMGMRQAIRGATADAVDRLTLPKVQRTYMKINCIIDNQLIPLVPITTRLRFSWS